MCFSLWCGSNVRHHFLTLNVTLDYVIGQHQHQRLVELLQHKGCCYFTCDYFIYRCSFSLVLDCLCWTHAHVTGRVIPSAPGSWLQTFSGLSWSCVSNRPSAAAGLLTTTATSLHSFTPSIYCLSVTCCHISSKHVYASIAFPVPFIIHVAFSWWIICISESDRSPSSS